MEQEHKVIRRKPAIDTTVERQIITGMIVSEQFCKRIFPIFVPNESLRSDFANTVASWCKDYHEKYKNPPASEIEDIFKSHRKTDLDPGQAEIIEEFLTSISHEYEAGDKFNVAYVFDKASAHFRLSALENRRFELGRCISSRRIEDGEKLFRDFKPTNVNDALIENIRQDVQDVEAVFVTSEPHVKNLQHILGEDHKVITIPSRIQKGAGEIFEGKNVTIILPKENLNSTEQFANEIKEAADSLKLVNFPIDSKLFKTLQGKRRKLFLRHSNQILHNRIHKTTDLAQKTLRKALDTMIIPFNQLKKQKLPKRKELLPWLNESDLALVVGEPGVGKTHFAMEIVGAIQNGRPAMGGLWDVGNPAKSLYVDGEMHWQDIIEMGSYLGLGKTNILSRTLMERHEIVPGLNLADADTRDLLFKRIIQGNYKIVVLDNIFSLFFGDDLDKASDWQEPNLWLLRLRSANVAVLLLHHTNKAGDQIGTSSRVYNLNTYLLLTPVKPQKTNDRGEGICSFRIKPVKQRAKGSGFGNRIFTCDDGKWTVTDDSKADKEGVGKADLIMALIIDGRLSGREIAEKIGCTPAYVSKIKNEARSRGYVKNHKPTSSGLEFLEGMNLGSYYTGEN